MRDIGDACDYCFAVIADAGYFSEACARWLHAAIYALQAPARLFGVATLRAFEGRSTAYSLPTTPSFSLAIRRCGPRDSRSTTREADAG